MKQIQMVDLKSQYDRIKTEVDEAIQDVINTSAFINGPVVKEFAADLENYLGVKHVIPCANGTDALQVALMALGLKPGDEVISTSFTFIATVEVIALLGLKPVLVDVDPYNYNIDPAELEKAITPNTKAIIPVHLFGQSSNMEAIMEIASKHKLAVIEDTCQAIGANYTFSNGTTAKSGTIGDIGCTSFFPSKNLGCYGDGGALFTNNDELAAVIRSIVNHGMKVRYHHDRIGVNSRLDSIQAAVLKVKLQYLDDYSAARNKAAAYYNEAFKDCEYLQTPTTASYTDHVFHQYTMVTKNIDRDGLQQFLKEKNIPAMIYYPIPLHLQKAFDSSAYKSVSLPVTEQLSKSVISLPMQTELDEEQLKYITDAVLEYCNR